MFATVPLLLSSNENVEYPVTFMLSTGCTTSIISSFIMSKISRIASVVNVSIGKDNVLDGDSSRTYMPEFLSNVGNPAHGHSSALSHVNMLSANILHKCDLIQNCYELQNTYRDEYGTKDRSKYPIYEKSDHSEAEYIEANEIVAQRVVQLAKDGVLQWNS